MIKKPITIHLSTGLEGQTRCTNNDAGVASQFNSEIVEVGKKKVNA